MIYDKWFSKRLISENLCWLVKLGGGRGGGEGYYHYLFFNKGERKGKKIYLAKKVYKKHISNTDR